MEEGNGWSPPAVDHRQWLSGEIPMPVSGGGEKREKKKK